MAAPVLVDPGSLLIDAAPGQPASGSVTIASAPADPSVGAAFTSGGDSFEVQSVAVTVQVWHRYTEQEIDELPPSMREAARKAGGYFEPQTTESDGTSPVAVPARAQVVVSVTSTSSAVGVTRGTLTLTGSSWTTVEVPVFAVVGTATATPVASYEELGLVLRPGDTATPTVTVAAPPPATVMATLTPDSDAIQVSAVIVRTGERHEWTDDELLDLPSQMREQARKDGWIEWHDASQSPPDTPIEVPGRAIVAVTLAITVPTADVPDELTSTLRLLSTSWQAAEVPIRVVISDFDAVPLTDRVSIRQGIPSDPVQVVLSSTIGPDTDVQFAIADAEPSEIQLDTPATHLPRRSSVNQSLRVTVAPNAVLGNYPVYLGESYDVGLRVTAFNGVYERRFPLGLTLLPGTVTVAALQAAIQALQDSTTTCQVSVVVSGGLKEVTFRADALPSGVEMATATQDLTGPVTTEVTLQFTVAPDAPPDETLVTIAWDAGDGANAGAMQLPFTVQLRPESRTFSEEVVTPTGTALGGHVEVTLNNLGAGTFSGAMRATGLPSYKFRVRAVVRSASGLIAIAQQRSGEVFGTDTPGDREYIWSEDIVSALAASQWPEIRTASMVVSKSYEMSGVLGTVEDLAVDFVEFLATSAILAPVGGSGLAAVIFVGSELGVLTGARPLGPGGLIGVIAAGGVTCLLGPMIVFPVLVGGVLVSDAVIQHRRLNAEEVALAGRVFGDTLPVDRILLTNLSGIGGTEFTVPNSDGTILVNFGNGFDDAVRHFQPARGYPQPGQLLIHELTHAWQIANAGETPEYYWRAAMAKLAGKSAYRYGPPGPPFRKFGLEQQATLVEEWAVGTAGRATVPITGRALNPPVGMQENDPYFGYIANNIRMGLA
jgi:hypothetical protein